MKGRWMVGRMDERDRGWMNGRLDEKLEGWTNGIKLEERKKDGRLDGWMKYKRKAG